MTLPYYTTVSSAQECSDKILPMGWNNCDALLATHDISMLIDGFVSVSPSNGLNANQRSKESDSTKLVIQAYRSKGTDFLRSLRGSFALALRDPDAKCLILAVDPLGTRSLYYTVVNGALYFSPRIMWLAQRIEVSREIDCNSLYFFLNHSFIPAPFTIYRSIKRLEPGQFLTWQRGEVRVAQYWDMTYPEDDRMEEGKAAELIASAVEESVRFALNAGDGLTEEVGAFLSGGTDSSTVAGLMTRIAKQRVKTFSVGFDEERYNELHYARVAAGHFNCIAHECVVHPNDALAAIGTISQDYDEPFGNSSALPTYFCLKMASEAGVRTMFAGDGGDELFGGNERYLTEKVFWYYQNLPSWLRFVLDHTATYLPSTYPIGKLKNYIAKANLDAPARFFAYQLYYRDHAAEFLSDDFRVLVDRDFPLTVPRRHYERAAGASRLNRLLYLDLKLAIGDNDLFKVNRMAESQGIQVRYPFLDKELAMASAKVPSDLKLKGWSKRYIFKRAFAGLLPQEILRKKKHGFGLPTGEWLRTNSEFRDLARSLLLDSRSVQRGYFKKPALENLLRKHDEESSGYFGSHIWNFMMLELWHRNHFDARNCRADSSPIE